MKQIRYETYGIRCLTKCPNKVVYPLDPMGRANLVGSGACEKCVHFAGYPSEDEDIIECNFPDGVESDQTAPNE